MKQERDFIVYATDADGSERKAGTYHAKSIGHARNVAMRDGVRRITDVVDTAALERKAAMHFYERQFG